MEENLLEVFAEDSGFGVVRMPGRSCPGCVVQGDSPWKEARRIAKPARDGSTEGDGFREAVEELQHALLKRMLHYQDMLRQESIDLPCVRADDAAAIRLTGKEGDPR